MEPGVALPTSGRLASPANIVRIAQEAERLGYAAIWTYERLLRPMAELPSRTGGPPERIPKTYRLVYEPLDAQLRRRRDPMGPHRRRHGRGSRAMRACWGPDPVEFEGRFYRIAPSEVNPKPVQERLPVLLGATTPAGARRAGRIADGINPIAFAAEVVPALATVFRQAAEAAGRDPAGLSVVVRANVPITREPLGDGRPFLGGAPRQIAEDVARLEPAGVDQVLFSSRDPRDLETEVGLLGELREAVAATA
jgi:alkanesulfonate monooxygenase SsuD/methylene tetrahydromethanopterin reductase-like flavin-dependent oxidoreductase (luciferase family)